MTTTTSRLRTFTPADYEAWVAVSNACFPEYAESVEEIRHRDDSFDTTRYFRARLVAEERGAVVGGMSVYHKPGRFHPDRYGVDLFVLPDRRRQGHGSALHAELVRILRERNAIAATTGVKESMTDGVDFARKRGWAEVKRDWESRLPVASFDFLKFAGADERIEKQGIRLATLADERVRDANADRKLYEVVEAARVDVPATDAATPETFEEWRPRWIDAPNFLADACFVAVDRDGRWIGMSNLERAEDPVFLWQGLTGVRREHRGRGVAMALKLRTVRYAQRCGVDHIKTWNDQTNRPMLAINEAMGFVKQPAWIALELKLRD